VAVVRLSVVGESPDAERRVASGVYSSSISRGCLLLLSIHVEPYILFWGLLYEFVLYRV
jgi:hypothetical protein